MPDDRSRGSSNPQLSFLTDPDLLGALNIEGDPARVRMRCDDEVIFELRVIAVVGEIDPAIDLSHLFAAEVRHVRDRRSTIEVIAFRRQAIGTARANSVRADELHPHNRFWQPIDGLVWREKQLHSRSASDECHATIALTDVRLKSERKFPIRLKSGSDQEKKKRRTSPPSCGEIWHRSPFCSWANILPCAGGDPFLTGGIKELFGVHVLCRRNQTAALETTLGDGQGRLNRGDHGEHVTLPSGKDPVFESRGGADLVSEDALLQANRSSDAQRQGLMPFEELPHRRPFRRAVQQEVRAGNVQINDQLGAAQCWEDPWQCYRVDVLYRYSGADAKRLGKVEHVPLPLHGSDHGR